MRKQYFVLPWDGQFDDYLCCKAYVSEEFPELITPIEGYVFYDRSEAEEFAQRVNWLHSKLVYPCDIPLEKLDNPFENCKGFPVLLLPDNWSDIR
ncbi:hypothetical protein D6827_02005 [Candidatus Parcubacteria bacterium]|nr:MAG: hypothetical protein D6827_02005 [Candidatus Parcubacteria bacterium]